MKTAIKETHAVDSFFQLLDENNNIMYYHCMNIQFLETMVAAAATAADIASRTNKLMKLIEEYKDAIIIF